MPYYDDNGNELNPDLIPKPALCVGCLNDGDTAQYILCTLTRLDLKDDEEFLCYAFKPITRTDETDFATPE